MVTLSQKSGNRELEGHSAPPPPRSTMTPPPAHEETKTLHWGGLLLGSSSIQGSGLQGSAPRFFQAVLLPTPFSAHSAELPAHAAGPVGLLLALPTPRGYGPFNSQDHDLCPLARKASIFSSSSVWQMLSHTQETNSE